MIITICGSMRFFDRMLEVAANETAKGNIVLMPFSIVAPDDQGSDFKAMLDRLHREKIDMADHVVIVTDQDFYMGESTRAELAYAMETGKTSDVRKFAMSKPTPARGIRVKSITTTKASASAAKIDPEALRAARLLLGEGWH